jgi:hypothetical protein
MTPAEVLTAARASGVTLWPDGETLRYRGPREVLTADFLHQLKTHKPALLAALARPDPRLPPLSRASEARRRKVLAMLARDGVQYAILVENPHSDPVVMAVATPDGTREVLIPRDRYDPFEVLTKVGRWDTGRADP